MIRLRRATIADADNLRAWRNESRESFFDTNEVNADDHRVWLQTQLLTPGCRIYIVENDTVSVGTISLYNIERTQAEMGRVAIGAQHRRKGYARGALAAVITEAKALGLSSLRASVKAANHAARVLYADAGFVELSERGNINGTVAVWVMRNLLKNGSV